MYSGSTVIKLLLVRISLW